MDRRPQDVCVDWLIEAQNLRLKVTQLVCGLETWFYGSGAP